MRSRSIYLIMLFTVVLSVADAQYAEDALRFSQMGLGTGARSVALGGTTVGRADDYSALFGNPAGLALSRDYEVSIGFFRNGIQNSTSFFGQNSSADNSSTTIENAGLVYPIPTTRGSLTFAVGYGRIANYTSAGAFDGFNATSSLVRSLAPVTDLYQMSVEDERDLLRGNVPFQLWLADTLNGYLFPVLTDSLQQHGTVLEGGGTNFWSFGGGIDVARNVAFGLSLNFVSGSYTYDREFTESDDRNVYRSTYAFPYNFSRWTATSTIESELTGFNVLMGLMVRQQGRYRLGLSLRTPTTYEINETYSDGGVSVFDDGARYSKEFSNKTSYKVVTPYVFSGGVSVQAADWLSVSADAEYTDWTQVKFDMSNPDLLEENRYIKKSFRETVNLRGGIEVTLWEQGIVLRGGAAMLPSPYKNDPSSFDQKYVTGGIGIDLEQNTVLNITGAYGFWKSFKDNYYVDGQVQPSTYTERVANLRLSVGLTYRF